MRFTAVSRQRILMLLGTRPEVIKLALRDTAERPEVIEAGCAKLVAEASRLLNDDAAWVPRGQRENPFGDGRTAEWIAHALTMAVRDPVSSRV